MRTRCLRPFGVPAIVVLAATLSITVLSMLVTQLGAPSGGCGDGTADTAAASIVIGPGTGARVGATEYGGPGDPSSGVVGVRGENLLAHPDSYAELGGTTWTGATAMGGLAYLTPLRITWDGRSTIAYKRDIGLGGGPIDGLPRVIDLWWQLAGRLGIPYDDGRWSGPVRIERPAAGAANLLGEIPVVASNAGCAGGGSGAVVPVAPGAAAQLLPGGIAAAPARAPAAVSEIIAAGNGIVGRPYVYGAAHGVPLSEIAPAYDCSSSVEHLLFGARLLPVDFGGASSQLEAFGRPGPGRWVTLYANPDHVFMYVAGLRWDTWNAAGAGDGTAGIGWHPLVRSASGFLARHPVGL